MGASILPALGGDILHCKVLRGRPASGGASSSKHRVVVLLAVGLPTKEVKIREKMGLEDVTINAIMEGMAGVTALAEQ